MKMINVTILVKNMKGGTGTVVSQLLDIPRYKKNINFNVLVFGTPQDSKNIPANYQYFHAENEPLKKFNFSIELVSLILRELYWVHQKLYKNKADVLITIDTHSNILGGFLKYMHFFKGVLIITIHNNLEKVIQQKISSILKQILKWVGVLVLNSSNHVVAVSQGIAKQYSSFFTLNKTIIVIPNGISLDRSDVLSQKPIDKRYAFVNKANIFTITSIGRFEVQKDFHTLIKAYLKIKKQAKDIQLVLIGDGHQKQELIDLIGENPSSVHIHFIGWQKNVFPYLKKSSIFVLSSNYEGFSLSILEAMSQGLPIISTNTPYGPAEILKGGKYGILTPIGNKKKMAEAILSLIDDKEKRYRYAQLSLTRVKEFSEEVMLNKYIQLILS